MEKTIKIFKYFSERGYKHYTDNTIEELDELPLDNYHIITEFTHLCEWLRINHGIWVTAIPNITGTKWKPVLMEVGKDDIYDEFAFNSPQKAYSAAFDYVLNNLI